MIDERVLFLDFDGVLHPNLCAEERLFERAPALAAALGEHATAIVISSSWRFHHDEAALLARLPAALARRVIGITGAPVVGRHARWQEIRAWCTRHGVRHWRALDDAAFEFPPGCAELLLCDGARGADAAVLDALRAWAGSRLGGSS